MFFLADFDPIGVLCFLAVVALGYWVHYRTTRRGWKRGLFQSVRRLCPHCGEPIPISFHKGAITDDPIEGVPQAYVCGRCGKAYNL